MTKRIITYFSRHGCRVNGNDAVAAAATAAAAAAAAAAVTAAAAATVAAYGMVPNWLYT